MRNSGLCGEKLYQMLSDTFGKVRSDDSELDNCQINDEARVI